MFIVRVGQSIGVDYMKDKLLPEDGITLDDFAEHLKRLLLEYPDSVYILQVWEGRTLRCFVIAFDVIGKSWIWLQQAWCDPKLPREWKVTALGVIKQWAEELGKTEIRAETLRSGEAFDRLWGFEPISTVISLKLDDTTQQENNDVNGKQQHDES